MIYTNFTQSLWDVDNEKCPKQCGIYENMNHKSYESGVQKQWYGSLMAFRWLFTWQLRPLVRISKDCFLQKNGGAHVPWHRNKDTNMNQKLRFCSKNMDLRSIICISCSSNWKIHRISSSKWLSPMPQEIGVWKHCFFFIGIWWCTNESNHQLGGIILLPTPPGIAGIKQMGVVFCLGLLFFADASLRSFLAHKEIPSIPTNTNDWTAGIFF